MATLDLNGVTKVYKKKIALNNVTVHLENGIYGLLGPNGAGKTTLINIIAGVLKPDSGNISLNGRSINDLHSRYYDHIGFMPQYPKFYSNFTGIEVMRYVAALNNVDDKERISELLEFVNLTEAKDKKTGAYSGGMRQRLAIAAALVNDPDILILDEPTAGLDPRERIRFKNIISQISGKRIMIIATHIVSDVEYLANKIILLQKGEIIDSGSSREISGRLMGKVWNIKTDSEEMLSEYQKKLNVSSVVNEGTYTIKCISEEKPAEEAVPAVPCLDDVFLYRFCDKG